VRGEGGEQGRAHAWACAREEGRRGSGARGRAARPGGAREQRKEGEEGRRREKKEKKREGKKRKKKRGGKEKRRRKENREKEKEKEKWWKEKKGKREREKKGWRALAIFTAVTAAGRPRARDVRTLREEKKGGGMTAVGFGCRLSGWRGKTERVRARV
jgi:hypothetical protein